MLRQLAAQFGEIRLSGSEDDPRVDLALIGVDTEGIIRDNRHADDAAARRRLIRAMIWAELKIKDEGTFEARTTVTWRGTSRAVDVLMDNVRDQDRMPSPRFQADPGTIRMVIDYPFDEDNRFPADDVRRVNEIKDQLGDEDTIIWLPHFLSDDRVGRTCPRSSSSTTSSSVTGSPRSPRRGPPTTGTTPAPSWRAGAARSPSGCGRRSAAPTA